MKIKDMYKRIFNIEIEDIIFSVVILLIFIGFVWITGTPQGAVRRHLLFSDGIKTAAVAEIRVIKSDELHTGEKAVYSVIIDGDEEQWQFWIGRYACFGEPKTKSSHP